MRASSSSLGCRACSCLETLIEASLTENTVVQRDGSAYMVVLSFTEMLRLALGAASRVLVVSAVEFVALPNGPNSAFTIVGVGVVDASTASLPTLVVVVSLLIVVASEK